MWRSQSTAGMECGAGAAAKGGRSRKVQSVNHSCTGGGVFSAEQLSSFLFCACVQKLITSDTERER